MHGVGPSKTKYPILFVGDFPCAMDEKKASPFCGDIGSTIIDPMLTYFGVKRSQIYMHNVLGCRPRDNKMSSSISSKAVKLCPSRLLFPFIKQKRPAVILTMGVAATNAVTQCKNVIKNVRGIPQRVTLMGDEYIVIPTYHPGGLIPGRNSISIDSIYADFERALTIAKDGYKEVEEKYYLLDTKRKVVKFFDWVRRHPNATKFMSFDVESQSKVADAVDVFQDKILGLSFSWKDGHAAYIPLRHRPDFTYCIEPFWGDDQELVVQLVREVLENKGIKKGGQNKKFDNKISLLDLNIDTTGVVFDTMLASHALNENQISHSLDDQARLFVPEKKKWKDGAVYKDMASMPLKDIAYYCNSDADIERRLCKVHKARLARFPKLHKMFREYVMPLQRAIQAVELRGAPIDKKALKLLSRDLEKEQRRLEAETRSKFGRSVKVDSVPEVLALLYDSGVDLSLLEEKDFDGEVVRDSKGSKKYKTDRPHLEIIAKLSPLAQLILDTRAVSKLKSTYVDPIGDRIIDGVIHPSILMHSTVTGRPSSREPNLMNIPRGGKDGTNARHVWGKRVKGLYRAKKGHYVLQADYSQMEVRSFAYYSGDAKLALACTQGDVHLSTACMAYKMDFDKSLVKLRAGDSYVADKRQVAKSAAFLVFYGGSPEAASVLLGIPVEDVREFIDAYFNEFVGANKWIEKIHKEIDKNKVVTDAFGWMRRIPYAGQKYRIGEAHRQSVNSIIQGFSSRVCLMALTRLEKRFAKEKLTARTSLTVYDSIIPMNVPHNELADTVYVMQDEMSKLPVPDFNVPLRVDFEYGDRWSELEEFKLSA